MHVCAYVRMCVLCTGVPCNGRDTDQSSYGVGAVHAQCGILQAFHCPMWGLCSHTENSGQGLQPRYLLTGRCYTAKASDFFSQTFIHIDVL